MPKTKDIEEQIISQFGNKLRIRVCGFLIKNNALLLVKHHNLGETGILWAPPGGGMNFGESAKDCLIREFKEETNLDVEVGELICVSEYLDEPLHAIELFFCVSFVGGELKTGEDPELLETQIIDIVDFVPFDVLSKMENNTLHKVLHNMHDEISIERLSGKYLSSIKN